MPDGAGGFNVTAIGSTVLAMREDGTDTPLPGRELWILSLDAVP